MEDLLRPAGLADLDTVMFLEESGFPPGIVEDRAVFAQRISAFSQGFLLAGDPVWGYFCAEIWSAWDPSDPRRFDLGHDISDYHDPDGDTLYVASMTVEPGSRGTGRGRQLFRAGLDQMVSRFPRLRRAVLIVNEHWDSARTIYRSEGFRETGRIPGFFQPREGAVGAAVIMIRETGSH